MIEPIKTPNKIYERPLVCNVPKAYSTNNIQKGAKLNLSTECIPIPKPAYKINYLA